MVETSNNYVFTSFKRIIAIVALSFCVSFFSHASQQLNIILPSSTICPYTDPNISYTSYLKTTGAQYWEYHWTFDQGVPSTAIGNNPTVEWEQEGTFLITLTAKKFNGNDPPLQIDEVIETKWITINATCCAEAITNANRNLSGTISTNTNYYGVYYVDDDLVIDADVNIYGTWLVKGETNLLNDPPSVTGKLITVNSSRELNIIHDGEIRGECENMWMGIRMEENADFHTFYGGAKIKDMWHGIHPAGGDEFFFTIYNATFLNNRIGISSNQTNLGGSSQRIFGSTFSSDGDFLSPYDGGNFISFKHVEIRGDYSYITYFADNELSNAFVGLDFKSTYPAFAIGSLNNLTNNSFENLYFVGARMVNSNEVYVEGNDFYLTSDQSYGVDQLANFLYEFPDFDSQKRIALDIGYVNDEFCQITDNTYITDGLDYDFSEDVIRYGIYYSPENAAYSTSSFSNIADNVFDGMNFGMYIEEDDGSLLYVENIFTDNEYAIFFNENSDSYVHNLICNEFNKTSNTSSTTTHGLYIENGSTIGNIGTDAVIDRGNYNKWAVDPLTGGGYPGSYTSNDPKQWDPPANWFSIYDENATSETSPNINYYVYKNIYVGDKSSGTDAVYPTSMIQRATSSNTDVNADVCPTFTLPTFRIGGKIANTDQFDSDINIYPNPSNGYIKINSSAAIDSYGVYSLEGVELKSEEMPLQNRLYLNDLPKGIYILRLIETDGEVTSYKLEIL